MTSQELYQEIYYGNDRFKFVDEFFNTKETVYNYARASRESGRSGGLTSKTEKTILEKINIHDFRGREEVNFDIASIVRRLSLTPDANKVRLKFNVPESTGACKVIIKGNRSTCVELRNVDLTKAEFIIRDRFRIYKEEAFSVAFSRKDISVSVGVAPSSKGIKGMAQAVIKVIREGVLYIDDLGKYMDTRVLLEGMAP